MCLYIISGLKHPCCTTPSFAVRWKFPMSVSQLHRSRRSLWQNPVMTRGSKTHLDWSLCETHFQDSNSSHPINTIGSERGTSPVHWLTYNPTMVNTTPGLVKAHSRGCVILVVDGWSVHKQRFRVISNGSFLDVSLFVHLWIQMGEKTSYEALIGQFSHYSTRFLSYRHILHNPDMNILTDPCILTRSQ